MVYKDENGNEYLVDKVTGKKIIVLKNELGQ
jgi:hypothetical protein